MSTVVISGDFLNEESLNLEVRIARAKNVTTSPYVLKNLSKDPDSQVRFHVASNPGTPEGCLWELSYDNNTEVCKAALNTLDSYGLRFPGHKIPLIAQFKASVPVTKSSSDD